MEVSLYTRKQNEGVYTALIRNGRSILPATLSEHRVEQICCGQISLVTDTLRGYIVCSEQPHNNIHAGCICRSSKGKGHIMKNCGSHLERSFKFTWQYLKEKEDGDNLQSRVGQWWYSMLSRGKPKNPCVVNFTADRI